MNHIRLQFFLFSLMSVVAAPAFADETKAILPEKEEDIPVEFIPTLDTTISVGLRRLNNGPKVRFGNLGSLSQSAIENPNDETTGFKSRYYTDGVVYADSRSGYELDALGAAIGSSYESNGYKVLSSGGIVTVYTSVATAKTNGSGGLLMNADGTYIPNTVTVQNSDGTSSQSIDTTYAATSRFLGYQDNQARNWSVLNKSQIYQSNGKYYADMHSDSIVSSGASLEADSSASTGFDLSIERRLGKRGKWEWGVSAGVKFAFINAKAAGTFPAIFMRLTDTYELNTSYAFRNGVIGIDQIQPSGNATNLNLEKYTDGSLVYRYTDASTAPLSYTTGADLSYGTTIYTGYNDPSGESHPVTYGSSVVVGTVMVHGVYSLKGAYLLSHVGPTFRYSFNDRWAVSGTVGLALGWIGTNFKATEWYNTWNDVPVAFRPDDEGNTTEFHWNESNATHKFRPGLYYDLNLEYWVTDRTGFYGGVTGQKMSDYSTRKLSGRTAEVDFGQNTGWTIGIRTRF